MTNPHDLPPLKIFFCVKPITLLAGHQKGTRNSPESFGAPTCGIFQGGKRGMKFLPDCVGFKKGRLLFGLAIKERPLSKKRVRESGFFFGEIFENE